MKEITITIDEKEMTICKELNKNVGQMIVHNYSQVPTRRSDDERFNKLREIALIEWYKNCGDVIKRTIEAEVDYPKIIAE